MVTLTAKRLQSPSEKNVEERASAFPTARREQEWLAKTLSHDARAPLRSQTGFAMAMLEDYAHLLPAEAKDYLNRIVEAARRGDLMLQDLVRYLRLDRETIYLRQVELDTIIGRVKTALSAEGEKTVTFEHPAGFKVYAEPDLMQAILVYLVRIFRVQSQVRGSISLRIKPQKTGRAILEIESDAELTEEQQQEVLGLFGEHEALEKYPLAGTGLAIIRKACNLMKWQLAAVPADKHQIRWIFGPGAS